MTEWMYVPVTPQVKQRPRLGRRRRVFTPEATQVFENTVKEWWTENGHHWENVPISVEIEIADKNGFYVRIHELEASYRPVGVLGDVDNYVKAISDGLNTAAWDDDKQIEWLTVRFVGQPRKPFYRRKNNERSTTVA